MKLRIFFALTLLIQVLTYTNALSQCVRPQWQKNGLNSYSHAVEIMDNRKDGFWVAFWGVPMELIKETLLNDSVAFMTTDSSIIIEQDILSQHELIFDNFKRLVKTHSVHKVFIDHGYDYSKFLRERYQVVYDYRAYAVPFGDNGIEYEWIFQDASGRIKTRMTNEIREGYYFIDVYMEKNISWVEKH